MGLGPGYALLDLILATRPSLLWTMDSKFTTGNTARDLTPNRNNSSAGQSATIGTRAEDPDGGLPSGTSTDFTPNARVAAASYAPFSNGNVYSYLNWVLIDVIGVGVSIWSGSQPTTFPTFFLSGAGPYDVNFYPDHSAGATTWSGCVPAAGWHCLGLRFDEPNNLASAFVDGSLISTQTQAQPFNAATGVYILGGWPFGFANLDGAISISAVWEYGIEDGDFLAFWKAGAASVGAGGDGLVGTRRA